jgi:hypothetical protein
MALPLWSLITVEELKDDIQSDLASGQINTRLERICRRVTARIEAYCNRRLIYRGSPYTEYHSMSGDSPYIYTLDYPIISVSSLHEDFNKLYGAGTLVASNLYVIETGDELGRSRSRIAREHDWSWYAGVDVLKLVYAAGYANRSAVPDDIKDVALGYGTLLWRQIADKSWGIVQRTEVTGAITRWNDRNLTGAHLTVEMKDALQPYVRESWVETGRRAA